jgi:hypothetical protein
MTGAKVRMAAALVGVAMLAACAMAQPSPKSVTVMGQGDGGGWEVKGDKLTVVPGQPLRTWLTEVRPGGKMEKGTFLGVATTRVTGVLRANLKLQQGVGLVVEQVVEESPAAAAGLRRYDILQKFNDQLLVNPQQLGSLVRLAKAGEQVTLSVLREGEPVSVTVKLVEKDVPAMDEAAGAPWGDAIAPWGPAMGKLFLDSKHEGSLKSAIETLRNSRHDSMAAFTYADAEHTLEITRKDGKRRLVAKEKGGKLVFEGPIDTDKQREELPEAIREKLKEVDERMKMMGTTDDGSVKVRMLGPGAGEGSGRVGGDEK